MLIYTQRPSATRSGLKNARGNVSILLLGLLGILVVGTAYHLMRTHDTNLTSNKSFKENVEVDMMMTEIKMYLRSKASCVATFGGKKIGDTADRVSYFGVDAGNNYVADTNQFHATGSNIPLYLTDLRLDTIRLLNTSFLSPASDPNDWNKKFRFTKPPPPPPPPPAPVSIYTPTSNMSSFLAVFKFVKGPKLMLLQGRPEIVRIVPIEVALNGAGEIETCYYDSNSSESVWVADACNRIFGGTIMNSQCAHMNIKGSLSTDGYFCFNDMDPNNNIPGNIHKKHCVNSWYFEQMQCRIVIPPAGGNSNAVLCSQVDNEFMVGFSSFSCGKNCVKAQAMCCKSRLKNTGV